LQCATQSRRARRSADPEQARRGGTVELEDDAEREHLALARRQYAQRLLERRRQSVRERGLRDLRRRTRVAVFAASPALIGTEPVKRDVASNGAEPRTRLAAARVEPPP